MRARTTNERTVKEKEQAVAEAERRLTEAHDRLASLEAEQEGIQERLRTEALSGAESGEDLAVLQTVSRREALPWLTWAARVRVARLRVAHRDVQGNLAAEREQKAREALARDPGNERLANRVEDLELERRRVGINDHFMARELERLEKEVPAR